MIEINKRSALVFVFIFIAGLYGGRWQNSFGLVVGNNGTGISYQGLTKARSNVAFGTHIKLYDIKAENEFVVYNYYTGIYETTSEKYLILIPMFGFMNYYPFDGKIENNIAPFLTLRTGPLFTLDADELNDKFFDRWRKSNAYWTVGGYIGVGIDMMMQGGSGITVLVGRDFYPMKQTVDGKTEYGGLALEFSFSKTF